MVYASYQDLLPPQFWEQIAADTWAKPALRLCAANSSELHGQWPGKFQQSLQSLSELLFFPATCWSNIQQDGRTTAAKTAAVF